MPNAMTDPDAATPDELFAAAVEVYRGHYAMDAAAGAREPDRARTRFVVGKDPTVVLVDTNGVPLGTITWFEARAAFEPPTKITVVDHFQGFRPTKR